MNNILLIEDDFDDASFFQEILEEINSELTLHHSCNGLEAIKYLNLLKPDKPRFIFTDLNMPIMSGFEFLKQIKTYNSLKDIPVFVLTTTNDSDTRKQVLEMGATDFFTKPATIDGIRNILEEVIVRLQEH